MRQVLHDHPRMTVGELKKALDTIKDDSIRVYIKSAENTVETFNSEHMHYIRARFAVEYDNVRNNIYIS